MRMPLRSLVCLIALWVFPQAVRAENVCVVPGKGFFRVHADAGGLFGVFAHDHLIEAAKIEGCAAVDLQSLAQSSVKLTFAAAELHVVDPKEDAADRAKIQKTMETEVLHVAEYPTIKFESTTVMKDASDHYRVSGNLTIRGKTAPVVIPVTLTREADGGYRATGTSKLKQTAFGIQPIRLMGGTVRVKDEVRTEFEVFLK
jgi:polyisoprenoid-binding protein YceI